LRLPVIVFVATRAHQYTVRGYLRHAGRQAPAVRIESYERLLKARSVSVGTYVFADLERLTPTQLEKASIVWSQLELAGARLLNHPTRAMRRYELLRTLAEHGSNMFDAYRLTEARRPKRFPVFLRDENRHFDILSPLLATAEALDAAIAGLSAQGHYRDGVLMTEFRDTADEHGIYRKYSAFRICDAIVPAHVYFSRQWMFRRPDTMPLTPALLAEERNYVEADPHERQLRDIFELARIDYGRIDYGVDPEGGIQVWEINTNPTLIETVRVPGREATVALMDSRIASALGAVDSPDPTRKTIRIHLNQRCDPSLPTPGQKVAKVAVPVLRALGMGRYEDRLKRRAKALLRSLDGS